FAEGQDFDLYAHESHKIIEELITRSLNHVDDRNSGQTVTKFIELEDDWKIENTEWPTIADFNEKLGANKIVEYIEKWNYDKCWLYAIDFMEKKSLEYTDVYEYRVRFSIPTRRQPIPKHTASVYFSIEVSKVQPKQNHVKVYFVFETMRLIHRPDQFRFRQNWLIDIITLKERMLEGIDY
ncbi:unnamed protein product, partial [Didymodactylos carnosus]